jgi:division protein CdvB (Snf7/Vps24/ESCRT-III family)
MITEEILNRILAERDKAHAHELARLEAEYKAQSLEARLNAIEKKLEEGDKEEEESIAGFKISDLMQAYTIYQQTQNQTK